MSLLTDLAINRAAVLSIAESFRTTNVRLFGSALHGSDNDKSDIDLLVDPLPQTTLFDLGGLQVELEKLLGRMVDVLTPADLPKKFRAQVLAEARPVRVLGDYPITSTTCSKQPSKP